MQIILEHYAFPERGTFQIQETVTIEVTADEAKRQVNRWLLHEVNSQKGTDLGGGRMQCLAGPCLLECSSCGACRHRGEC
jgi:hypothetical protein